MPSTFLFHQRSFGEFPYYMSYLESETAVWKFQVFTMKISRISLMKSASTNELVLTVPPLGGQVLFSSPTEDLLSIYIRYRLFY